MQKTFMEKNENVQRATYLIDATDKILGHVATKAADILRGKHKPTYTPHVDTGDYVVVINAEKVRVTGNKLTQKVYLRYSGYQSGQRSVRLDKMIEKKPEKVIELAVHGMIPRGALGSRIRKKLKIYAGSEHPHQAQKPIALEI